MNQLVLAALATVALVACHDGGASPSPAPGKTMGTIGVTSAAFSAGAPITPQYTCDGPDQSPQLSWTSVPDAAKSIAIVVDDPDAPHGTFTHWIIWNIGPEMRMLGVGGNGGLGGGIAGTNDFERIGYSGPCPPKGQLHHYRFTVYALDAKLTLRPSDHRADLDKAMNAHVLAQGTLTGTFQH